MREREGNKIVPYNTKEERTFVRSFVRRFTFSSSFFNRNDKIFLSERGKAKFSPFVKLTFYRGTRGSGRAGGGGGEGESLTMTL